MDRKQNSLTRRDCFAVPLLAAAGQALGNPRDSQEQAVDVGGGKAVVATTSGRVQGYVKAGVSCFKGIPYGESTGGANRFRPPQARKPWTGIRSCLAYGPVCPQPVERIFGGDEANFLFPKDRGYQDEDCLRLNVWTPTLDTAAGLPVMVFLHGGGFKTGSSQELPAYDGENLAGSGEVVMVSVNHRLGVLGFLDLSSNDEKSLSCNAGMLDIVAALEWVHENARRFGGDPTRVTVFGQSGGAGKVAALLAMPNARGLFHRAIAQSGPIFKFRVPSVSRAMADDLAHTLRRSSLDEAYLRTLTLPALLEAADEVVSNYKGPIFAPDLSSGQDNSGWAPVMDGRALIAHPFGPIAPPISADVPLLVGTTLNELGNGIDDPQSLNLTDQGLRERVKGMVGARAGAVIDAFRQRTPHATPAALWSRIASAPVRDAAIQQCFRRASAKRAKAWLYWFVWQTPILDGRPGAFHTSELPFVFNNTSRCDSVTGGGSTAQLLAKRMAGAWIAFARSGDPNHATLPAWSPYEEARGTTMVFDNECSAQEAPDRSELESLAGRSTASFSLEQWDPSR